MASKYKFVMNIRGTPEYACGLLTLSRAAVRAGYDLDPGQFNRLGEIAIGEFAKSLRVSLPPRVPRSIRPIAARNGGGR